MPTTRNYLNGWPLLAWITIALLALAALVAAMAPDATEAARSAIRLTARTSLVLFSLAFVASSLIRLADRPATRWLLRNRRIFGLGFAISHLLHAIALFCLYRINPVLFDTLTTPVSFIAGGTAYGVIALMAATSFDTLRGKMGERAWARLHRTGAWVIWLFFLINFGKRAAFNWMYWPAMTIIFVALSIRLLAMQKRVGQARITEGKASD